MTHNIENMLYAPFCRSRSTSHIQARLRHDPYPWVPSLVKIWSLPLGTTPCQNMMPTLGYHALSRHDPYPWIPSLVKTWSLPLGTKPCQDMIPIPLGTMPCHMIPTLEYEVLSRYDPYPCVPNLVPWVPCLVIWSPPPWSMRSCQDTNTLLMTNCEMEHWIRLCTLYRSCSLF